MQVIVENSIGSIVENCIEYCSGIVNAMDMWQAEKRDIPSTPKKIWSRAEVQ